MVGNPRFELGSNAPKAPMLGQTTTIPDINTTNNWQRYGESNPELVVESHSCYHYTISPLAGIIGIKPIIKDSKSFVLSLNYIPLNINYVVKDCMTCTTNNIRFIIVVFCSSLIPSFWFVSISANL